MQPRKLTMKNFGPFINETLDFTEFENSGLFLISGKTGAGKTTIFDGMTYALFGQTSGNKRSGKEMRSLFAEETEETAVFFEFEHSGLIYQIQRQPEQVLAKKRGVGTTTRGMKATLTVLDATGQPQQQYTKNVDREIQALLHLTADQFFKIIMLPQGEFRNFLMASSKDKEQVLQRLFDTEIYQRLNLWLREKAAAAQQQIDEAQMQGETLVGLFQWQGELTTGLSLQETLQQWQADEALLKAYLQEQEEVVQTKQTQVTEAEQAFYAAEKLTELFQEQTDLQQKQQQLIAEANEITATRQEIAILSWFKEQQALLENIRNNQKTAEKLTSQLAEKESLRKKNQEQLAQWQDQRDQLEELRQDLLQDERRLLAVEGRLPLAKKATSTNEELQSNQRQLAKVEKEVQQLAAELTARQAEILAVEQLIATKNAWQEREVALLKGRQALEKWQQQVQQANVEKEQLAAAVAASQQADDKLQEVTAKVDSVAARFQELQQENIRMQIAKLSLALIPGTPCPVCGSVSHPAATQHLAYSPEAIQENQEALTSGEEQLAALRQEATAAGLHQEQAMALVVEKQGAVSQATVAMTKAWESLLAYSQPLFETITAETVADLFQAADQQQRLQQIAIQEGEAQLAVLQTSQQTALQQQTVLEQQRQQLKADGQELTGRLKEYQDQLQGADEAQLTMTIQELTKTVAAKQEQLATDAQQGEALRREAALLNQEKQGLEERLRETTEAHQALEANLQQALVAAPTEVRTLLAAEKWPSLTPLPDLLAQVRDHERQQDVVKERLRVLTAQLQDKEPLETAALAQVFHERQAELLQVQEVYIKKKSQLAHNQGLIQQLQTLLKQTDAQLARQGELQQLSDTIYGRNSYKTSLERYVLQAFLAEILEVANSRLQLLSKGRYRFELAESAGGRGMQGLDIDIYDDDAGDTRRVQTMSGGESFIAALSLALALADVIQNRAGGIPIEALFIDEGFGSLDEEALEMAMEALLTIEGEGRMIGIISHVAQLKERLTRQVLVETGAGQSRIKLKV